MSYQQIQGISIPIGGDATELGKILKDSQDAAKSLDKELKEINSSLKFQPDSLDLLAQKSEVLGGAIAAASEKLKNLKEHQAEVQRQAQSGEIGEEQYRSYQREILRTEDGLRSLQTQVKNTGAAIESAGSKTKDAAGTAESYRNAVQKQQEASEKARAATDQHGTAVRGLKDDYGEAQQGALTFSDVVKATAIGDLIADGFKKATSALWDFATSGAEAAREYEVNQQKLLQVLSNTTNATDEQIESVFDLIAAEEQLGVVSQNAQTAAAQELGTYLSKTTTLEKLIPAMNNMIAQQYGVNASQEAAVSVATQLGKTLDGQVGSLQRWGYTFTEAEQEILKGNNELRKMDVLVRVINDSVGGMNYRLMETTSAGELFHNSLDLQATKEQFGKNATEIKNSILNTILPSLTEGIQVINDVLMNNQQAIENIGMIVATLINALTNLIKLIGALPPELVVIISVIAIAVKMFTSAQKGISAFSSALGGAQPLFDQTTVKLLALVAVVSVLLFLILSLKEGSDQAAKSMEKAGNAAQDFTKKNTNTATDRKYIKSSSTALAGYASGTSAARRGLAWVGEDGPELVNFRGGEQVYTARQSVSMAGSGTAQSIDQYVTQNFHINVQGVGELDEVVNWYQNQRLRTRAAGIV